jgi:hypothetical protein
VGTTRAIEEALQQRPGGRISIIDHAEYPPKHTHIARDDAFRQAFRF